MSKKVVFCYLKEISFLSERNLSLFERISHFQVCVISRIYVPLQKYWTTAAVV